MTLIDFFDKGVQRNPQRPCLICGDESVSYGEVQRRSYLIAGALGRAGVRPGAHAAVLAHNGTRPFECVLGALRAGCTWVPVNARSTVREIGEVLRRTRADVLFYESAFAEAVTSILDSRAGTIRTICIDGDGIGGQPNLEALCTGISPDRRDLRLDGDALATLATSGGTTGSPKGVMTSNRTWAFRIAEVMVRLAHPDPVHLVAAPMTHGAGAGALELMAIGATHVILRNFDAGAVIDAIGRHKVSHMFLPPTALYRVLSHPDLRKGDYRSLAYLICGGAPMSPDRLREAVSVFGTAMHTGYGGTEFGGGLTWMPGTALRDAIARGDERRLLSCGRPSPVARIDILGDDGSVLPPEQPGEIVIRSYTLASGYYEDEEETRQAFRPEGFHTGDIGYFDREGWLYICDRRKDMIISGGFNIYPSEVEKVLMSHPAVQDCAVVGVPDQEWGESVKAVLELKANRTVEPAELEALCRASLAGFKVPRSYEIWPEIPRSPVGKVLKRVIRERYWQAHERKV